MTDTIAPPLEMEVAPASGRTFSRGFIALIVTQFFGAANDNILKGVLTFMVIDGSWQGRLGKGAQGIVFLCFTLPFILFSGYAGQFADRHSKQWIAVLLKILEIPIVAIAMIGFWMDSLWITLTALVILAIHSTFFGPAKYGMIPELVVPDELSRANGAINMMTNIAVIVGTLAAGIIADRYNPQRIAMGVLSTPLLWLPGAVMVMVALGGLCAVMFVSRLPAGDRTFRYVWDPFSAYVKALREMARSPLLAVALAWAYFYFLAGLALLIIPEYTIVLNVTREVAARLLGVMGIAIGIGSVAAGWLSGHEIRPRLIPLGALGMTVFFILLGAVRPTFWNVACLIFGAGVFAGFYIIPLQALLQKLSPADERGRFLGTSNALSFGFLAIASLLYWFMRPSFGTEPQRIFLICAALLVLGVVLFAIPLRRFVFGGHENNH